jgi:hypothetical protein
MGFELFLDSFENSNYYLCLQDKNNILKSNANGDYIILQKSSHPDFKIEESDCIIYYNYNGEISYSKVNHINTIYTTKRYHIENQDNEQDSSIIFDNQILGKIIKVMDDSILNSISLSIWEISINNLNLRALIIRS